MERSGFLMCLLTHLHTTQSNVYISSTHSYSEQTFTPLPVILLHSLTSHSLSLPYQSFSFTPLPVILFHSLTSHSLSLPYQSFSFTPLPVILFHSLTSHSLFQNSRRTPLEHHFQQQTCSLYHTHTHTHHMHAHTQTRQVTP